MNADVLHTTTTLEAVNLIIKSVYLFVFLFSFHHQGAIPRRDWAARETGPRTFRSTSKTAALMP